MELVLRNRRITREDLESIRSLIEAEGARGRTHLSARLCRLWDWRQPNGAFREIACRDLLRQLDRRGLIQLPPPRTVSRRPGYAARVRAPRVSTERIEGPLASRRAGIRVELVQSRKSLHLVRDLLGAYHYLGYRQPTGASLNYLLWWEDRPLACARFGPAAWKVGVRERFLGWKDGQRRTQLGCLVNNDRFLILPWVRLAHLASFFLGQLTRRLARDWREVHCRSILLAETFVDTARFEGTCYRAANWRCLGHTEGRGRNDRRHQHRESIKSLWIHPLTRHWRQELEGRRR